MKYTEFYGKEYKPVPASNPEWHCDGCAFVDREACPYEESQEADFDFDCEGFVFKEIRAEKNYSTLVRSCVPSWMSDTQRQGALIILESLKSFISKERLGTPDDTEGLGVYFISYGTDNPTSFKCCLSWCLDGLADVSLTLHVEPDDDMQWFFGEPYYEFGSVLVPLNEINLLKLLFSHSHDECVESIESEELNGTTPL